MEITFNSSLRHSILRKNSKSQAFTEKICIQLHLRVILPNKNKREREGGGGRERNNSKKE